MSTDEGREREAAITRLSMIQHLSGGIAIFLRADTLDSADPLAGELDRCRSDLEIRAGEIRERYGLEPGGIPPEVTAEEILPGPYRINPEDGNTYRVEYEVPARQNIDRVGPHGRTHYSHIPARVIVTDVLGGHEMTIDKTDWESWDMDISPQMITRGGSDAA